MYIECLYMYTHPLLLFLSRILTRASGKVLFLDLDGNYKGISSYHSLSIVLVFWICFHFIVKK